LPQLPTGSSRDRQRSFIARVDRTLHAPQMREPVASELLGEQLVFVASDADAAPLPTRILA